MIKLILIVLQLVESLMKRHHKRERIRRVAKIRKDPVSEWNRRFGRMPIDADDANELPANDPESTPRDK